MLTPLNRQLTDLGGMPVLWDSDLGTLVQDPTQGGTNAYGPGDLFRDQATGDLYQLGNDGQLSLFRIAAAPIVPNAPMGAAATPPITAGTQLSSAAGAFSQSAPLSSTAAITPTGNPTQFGHQVVSWLSKASFIGGLPNGVLVLFGYIGYTFVKQRRRLRNPTYRNPGRAKRTARRRAHEYVGSLLPAERGSRATMSPATRALRTRHNRRRLSERIVMRSYGY